VSAGFRTGSSLPYGYSDIVRSDGKRQAFLSFHSLLDDVVDLTNISFTLCENILIRDVGRNGLQLRRKVLIQRVKPQYSTLLEARSVLHV
jgi:hypothetical protein